MNETPVSATRMDAVQTPIVPIIGALLRQTPGAISLGQGVVHYGPPPEAAEAARAAIARSETDQYQDVAGLPALLDRIARKLAAENGIGAARGRIMVTAGANMAFMHAVLATTSPGDEVILPIPFYFNHEMAVQMAGCRVVCVPTDECYQLSIDAIARAIGSRTRAIVTISPNNPSGAVYAESALRRINELCRDRGLYHISDETYEYFTYGSARHVSPGSFADAEGHTISLYSMSKAYGFAGWRIGYMVYPARLASAMSKIQDTISDLPADRVAGGRHCRARRRPHVLRASRPRARLDPRDRRRPVVGACAAGDRAGGRRRLLLPAQDQRGRAERGTDRGWNVIVDDRWRSGSSASTRSP